jgi:hypothetical protein
MANRHAERKLDPVLCLRHASNAPAAEFLRGVPSSYWGDEVEEFEFAADG